ncbi:MAG: DUF4278 domain-containing protein [Nodosilinea sp.]
MKLTYRGVSYDYTPPTVETNITGEVGKFRGLDIRFRTIRRPLVQQPTLDLVYRGVAYQTGSPAVEVPASAVPAVVVETANSTAAVTEAKARQMMMNDHRTVQQRQQSMLLRLATEAGLAPDASHS